MPTDISLRSALDLYARHRLRGACPNTRGKYVYAIDHFARHLGREPMASDLTDDAVTDWLWWLRDQHVCPVTANSYGAKIRALWAFLSRRRLCDTFPEFQPLPVDVNLPVAWSRSELGRLFHAIDNTPGAVAGIPAAGYWRSLCLTLWDTGERIAATMSARWCDLRDNRLLIRAENRKGRAGHRRSICYRLHPQTVLAVESIRGDRELIWPWAKEQTMLWYDWRKILRAAGLPSDRYHMFHCFRRSVASHGQSSGLDASILLDHSDRRVTERYLSPEIVERPAPCDRLFRPGDDD